MLHDLGMIHSKRFPLEPSVALVRIERAENVAELPPQAQGKLRSHPGQDTMKH
jgi:hypothetical protein